MLLAKAKSAGPEISGTTIRSTLDGSQWIPQRARSTPHSIRVICFFEELEVRRLRGVVVDERSARIGGYECIGIHANHMDMAKFQGRDDSGYKSVMATLEHWRDEHIEPTNTTPPHDAGHLPRPLIQTLVPASTRGRDEVIGVYRGGQLSLIHI